MAQRNREHRRERKKGRLIAKFRYTDPPGLARILLRPGSPRNSVGSVRISHKVRAGPRGSGRARVVEFSLKTPKHVTCHVFVETTHVVASPH